MKIAVIVADASGVVGAGLDVERTFKVFDMPPEVAAYIARIRKNQYASVSLAIEDDAKETL